jgi:hypothetical protein
MPSCEKTMNSLERGVGYMSLAMSIEIAFTGSRNWPTLQGHTQLWVAPIYSLGAVFGFEPLHNRLRQKNIAVRASVYALFILGTEYTAGAIIKKLTGTCPWEYTSKYNIHGFIDASYFFVWAPFGLLGERVHDYFLKMREQAT